MGKGDFFFGGGKGGVVAPPRLLRFAGDDGCQVVANRQSTHTPPARRGGSSARGRRRADATQNVSRYLLRTFIGDHLLGLLPTHRTRQSESSFTKIRCVWLHRTHVTQQAKTMREDTQLTSTWPKMAGRRESSTLFHRTNGGRYEGCWLFWQTTAWQDAKISGSLTIHLLCV